MIKKVSKIILILLGYVFAGLFLFQITRMDTKVGKLNQKIEDLQYQNEMCEMKRGEEEVIHEESIMVLDAEKENLQTRVKELEEEVAKLKKKLATKQAQYYLTAYWTGDGYESGTCTGSGKCVKDFQVNDKGWYTYNGRLVLAGATTYLLKYGYSRIEGKRYFKYGENVTVTINGVDYPGTIWDSCGACMKNNIIDLFVSGSQSSVGKIKVSIK